MEQIELEQPESQGVTQAAATLRNLRAAIHQAMVGQEGVIDQVLIALVASGHVLIEGVPGLGKTLLVRALAQALSLGHARVQFTPDMMPSDITGHAVLDPSTRELRICAVRSSPICCWRTKSIARPPRRRARCSK